MATVAVEERELLKSISWFDGFVVALANPSFLITALGASVLSLGGWGAVILWTVSVVLGAGHNYIYSETAAMFPKLSGGISIYAHEAWKKYFSFVGPISAFGYWIGWSVVLADTPPSPPSPADTLERISHRSPTRRAAQSLVGA